MTYLAPIVLLLTMFWSACQKTSAKSGILTVLNESIDNTDTFNIYRLDFPEKGDQSLIKKATFNTPIDLEPGEYLLSNKCSLKKVSLFNQSNLEFKTRTIHFHFQNQAIPTGVMVKCQRSDGDFEKTGEHLLRKMVLFEGKHNLSINQKKITIDDQKDPSQTIILSFGKISFNTNNFSDRLNRSRIYFKSNDETASTVMSFLANEENYLLPGDYTFEINGTERGHSVIADEHRTLELGNLLFFVPNFKSTLSKFEKITKEKYHLRYKSDIKFLLNEIYLVFPQTLDLEPMFFRKSIRFNVTEPINIIGLKSLNVDFNCSHWNSDCIGRTKFYLFNRQNGQIEAEGKSNLPILLPEDRDYLISFQGVKKLKYELKFKNNESNLVFPAGYFKFTPRLTHNKYAKTDLIDMISENPKITGKTMDFPLDDPYEIPFATGQYLLRRYTKYFRYATPSSAPKVDRSKSTYRINIRKGKTTTFSLDVYMRDEKKLESILSEKALGSANENAEGKDNKNASSIFMKF